MTDPITRLQQIARLEALEREVNAQAHLLSVKLSAIARRETGQLATDLILLDAEMHTWLSVHATDIEDEL